MKQALKIFVLLFFAFFALTHSYGSDRPSSVLLSQGFNLYGCDQKIRLADQVPISMHMSFFRNSIYRVLVSNPSSNKYKISLYDINKKLIFTEISNKSMSHWDFDFNSYTDCIIEVKPVDFSKNVLNLAISIGFKTK